MGLAFSTGYYDGVKDYRKSYAKKYRKTVLEHFKNEPPTKEATKTRNDILWMLSLFEKHGKLTIDYRDNASGNVVAYIHNKPTTHHSIWKVESILGDGAIFRT